MKLHPMLSRRQFLAESLIVGGGSLMATDTWAGQADLSYGTSSVLLYFAGELIPLKQLIGVQQVASSGGTTPNSITQRAAALGDMRSGASLNQIQIQLNWNNGKGLVDWITAAMAHAPTAANGSVLLLTPNLSQVQSGYSWDGGTAGQITLPACDATTTTAAWPILTIHASSLVLRGGGALPAGNRPLQHRPWLSNEFSVRSNVNLSLTRTERVSAIVLSAAGRGGSVQITLLCRTADEVKPWANALNQPGGQPLPGQSTDIAISYLAEDLRTLLASVTLHDCRVSRLTTQPVAGQVPMTLVTATVAFADAVLGLSA